MIPIVALTATAVLFLLFLAVQVWWQSANSTGIEKLSPVDLEAFRNLTDPEEERFLRANLSAKEFRRIQRTRLRAAAMYISVISKNAGRLVVIGRSVSAHPDAETAAVGLDVVHRALQLKLWCSLSLLKLNLTAIWPTLMSPSSRIADHYLNVTSLTASLPKKLAA
ncbi:MAG: hypothetical protein WBV31_20180 [Terriglobales bacterium]|jgi:hypothetical protein